MQRSRGANPNPMVPHTQSMFGPGSATELLSITTTSDLSSSSSSSSENRVQPLNQGLSISHHRGSVPSQFEIPHRSPTFDLVCRDSTRQAPHHGAEGSPTALRHCVAAEFTRVCCPPRQRPAADRGQHYMCACARQDRVRGGCGAAEGLPESCQTVVFFFLRSVYYGLRFTGERMRY